MLGATSCQSPAVAATEYKGELLIPRNDGNTLRRFQKTRRNSLIRSIHDLLEDLGKMRFNIFVSIQV